MMHIPDITARIHTLLGQCMKDREADRVLADLGFIISDEEDGPEFAKLIQQWVDAQ